MELSFLGALYDRPGPFASVYLDMRRTEAPRAIEVRRHVRCKELAGQGAPPETVAAVERVIGEEKERQSSGFLAVFAAGAEVVYRTLFDGPPARPDTARFAPLPHVSPLIAQRGEPVSRLVATVNRLGARVTGAAADGTRWDVEVPPEVTVPVHKPKGGDMLSQSRSQRAAEDSWRANAKRIARVIEQIANTCAAEVVVVAGDVRARSAVLEELPEPVLARTSESSGGPGLNADVAEAVERRRAERVRAAVERFDEQLTKGRRAVHGLVPVLGALRNAQVASLLIEDGRDVGAPVWVGPRCTDLASTAAELRDLGVVEPVRDRADAALVRALAGTQGELLLVTPDAWHAQQGLGAILRYADASM